MSASLSGVLKSANSCLYIPAYWGAKSGTLNEANSCGFTSASAKKNLPAGSFHGPSLNRLGFRPLSKMRKSTSALSQERDPVFLILISPLSALLTYIAAGRVEDSNLASYSVVGFIAKRLISSSWG